MEHHTLPGPCSWPCLYPFTYTVLDNSLVFVLSPLLFLFQSLPFLTAATYSLIGIGEILLLLTPIFENKLNSPFRQNLHLLLAGLAAAAILFYGFNPDLRYGVDPLRAGYYFLALSFLLLATASTLRFISKRNEKTSKF